MLSTRISFDTDLLIDSSAFKPNVQGVHRSQPGPQARMPSVQGEPPSAQLDEDVRQRVPGKKHPSTASERVRRAEENVRGRDDRHCWWQRHGGWHWTGEFLNLRSFHSISQFSLCRSQYPCLFAPWASPTYLVHCMFLSRDIVWWSGGYYAMSRNWNNQRDSWKAYMAWTDPYFQSSHSGLSGERWRPAPESLGCARTATARTRRSLITAPCLRSGTSSTSLMDALLWTQWVDADLRLVFTSPCVLIRKEQVAKAKTWPCRWLAEEQKMVTALPRLNFSRIMCQRIQSWKPYRLFEIK